MSESSDIRKKYLVFRMLYETSFETMEHKGTQKSESRGQKLTSGEEEHIRRLVVVSSEKNYLIFVASNVL